MASMSAAGGFLVPGCLSGEPMNACNSKITSCNLVSMTKQRVVIENVRPQVDSGRFPIKRVVGETVTVEADIFADSHDSISALLHYRFEAQGAPWKQVSMEPISNDRWQASFEVAELGSYFYTVEAWIDHFKTWRSGLQKKLDAGLDISVDLLIGSDLIMKTSERASDRDRKQLMELAEFLRTDNDPSVKVKLALDKDLAQLLYRYPKRELISRLDRELPVTVERAKARFSSWYEIFPRSYGKEGQHGTFKDCEEVLPELARMGFDVVYFPPIHPIGTTKRKGKNNSLEATPEDCGSPWAIGSEDGGHKATHPELGTLEDFRALVEVAKDLGIEIALDLAFQCSPDHPYVTEHPEWFRHRPDGTVQYAENPPKKYEDILPFEFENSGARELWSELKSVFEFWMEQGVTIFRVDNPHTKPFAFWEWVIPELRKEHPEMILLSEAFTRPRIMYRLGKLGFSQSYTYFAWRNTKWELSKYFRELTQTEVKEFLRSNAWPNTPDILTEYIQTGGRPAFVIRLILAATLSANYGIYGPVFEMCEAQPRESGSEEYLNSEKYELKSWDLSKAESFRDLISLVNRIRNNSPALQLDHTLQFHPVDNEQLICYSKRSADGSDLVIVVVNLDPHHTHSGWVEFPLQEFGIPADAPYQVHDLISEERYLWTGHRNYVELDPHVMPAHIFSLRRKVRSELDFEYFL